MFRAGYEEANAATQTFIVYACTRQNPPSIPLLQAHIAEALALIQSCNQAHTVLINILQSDMVVASLESLTL